MNLNPPPKLKLPAERLAIFLDVDGTLAPITSRPEFTRIPKDTRRTLLQMQKRGVALAALSGRPMTQVRRLLYPVHIPVGGSHGAQISFTGVGGIRAVPSVPSAMSDSLTRSVESLPGVWLERKPAAIAVHWRQAPQYCTEVERIVEQAIKLAPGWSVIKGHCVHELRAPGRDKGKALKRLMRRPEFLGRLPLAIGDDRTDEDAFRAALELGGAAIRVGANDQTQAPWQVKDVRDLAAWLQMQLRALDEK